MDTEGSDMSELYSHSLCSRGPSPKIQKMPCSVVTFAVERGAIDCPDPRLTYLTEHVNLLCFPRRLRCALLHGVVRIVAPMWLSSRSYV